MEIFPDPQNPAYVATVKGKLCLVRRRPDRDLKSGRKAHSKSPSKDSVKSKNSSSASRRSTSQPASRSSKLSSTHHHASVEDDTEEDTKPEDDPRAVTIDIPFEKVTGLFKQENIEKLREPLKKVGDVFTAANDFFKGDPTTKTVEQELDEKKVESFDKAADVFTSSLNKTGELFKGSSTTKTAQQEKAKAREKKVQKRLQKMADEKKASDDKSKSDKKTSSLPPGYPVQPGIYQYGGRTLALIPKGTAIGAAVGSTGYVGGAYAPGTYGQFPMGGMMMAPPMGMGMGMGMGAFGGFNSQYDKPVEITNVNPTANGSPAWTAQHACAGCGRLRSKKFQQENPLEVGEMPPISYCRKCEKEIKSTDDEDSDNERGRSKHKKHSKVRRTSRSSYKRKSKPRVVVQEFIVKEKHHKKSKKHKEKDSSEEESKSSVSKEAAAHLHICANCKNPRSKKYQARHPIKKGETPPPGFCGKCQKEETSSEEERDESDESDESESEEDITSVLSQERPSVTVSSRQYASVPSADGGMERVVTTRRHKANALDSPSKTERGIITTVQQSRAPAPIKVVEEYSSSSDSADLMPPPPLPHKYKEHHRSKSRNNKVTATNPIGKYLSTLIFGQKTYDSKGDGVIVQHHVPKHVEYGSDNEERGRGKDRAASQSHHHRHDRRSFYEAPSPLVKETIVTQTVPVRRRSTRARSLDRGERPAMGGRVIGASRHPSKPRKYFYTERGDTVSYDSEDDIEEIARDLYKTTLSDGAPMHEGRRHYQHHHEAQHHGGAGMSHSESFNSTNSGFSEASQRRRRERSQSGHAHVVYTQPVHQETRRQEPVLQRPPDEVIVTTERYVFKKPREPASTSRISSIHSEEIRHDKHEHESNSSGGRRHKKLITHDDRAEYYPESWSPRDSHGRKMSTSSSSRQVMAARGEARREHRHQPHYKSHGGEDSSSIAPEAGSFLDTDSNRSQASQNPLHDGTYHCLPLPSIRLQSSRICSSSALTNG